MPPIDQEKIDNFLEEWNRNLGREANPIWVQVQGLSSLMKVDVADDKKVTFYPNEGYIVQAFLNKETGEVKTFSASLFTKS